MQNSAQTIRVILLGDICGPAGRAVFQKHSAHLRKKYRADALIVNGENSASNGKGITSRIVHFFKHEGVNVITSGNHIWAQREIYHYLKEHTDLLRPANFPAACPGVGFTTFEAGKYTVGVINLQARTFMREFVGCPFRTADSILTYLKTKTNIILIDFHGEATSEKMGLAYYLDGQVSVVVGTHTHVLTADERILPAGTAYITDLGMSGALNSMIGMKKEPIIQNYLTQMPVRFEVDITPPMILTGVCVEIDTSSGKALSIEPIRLIDPDIHVDTHDEFAEKRHKEE